MNWHSRSDQYVYLRAKLPCETYDALKNWFGGQGQALKALRIEWERAVARVASEIPQTRSDGSASAAGHGPPA